MRLLIDLGNTRLKWRWWHDDGLRYGGECAHRQGRIGTELATALQAQPAQIAHISAVAAPELRAQVRHLLEQFTVHQDWLVSPTAGLGLRNSYAQPAKLGIDRWLALAAAYAETHSPCCVIDIGTATTVDVCDAQGQHQGGLIAPGPIALAQALQTHTALPQASQDLPQDLGFACDTEEALQYGALHSACGLVERAFELAHRQHQCPLAILTGGGAELLARYIHIPLQIDQDLVFKGLSLHARAYPLEVNSGAPPQGGE